MLDVLFVVPAMKPMLRQEINGTMLLATRLLQADFSVDVLRFWQVDADRKDYNRFLDAMTEQILVRESKCVSFYSLWPEYHTVIQIAQRLKQRRPDLTVVFGGPQASATAAETMTAIPWVDYVCAGEGENTVVPFFTALLRHDGAGLENVPGLYHRSGDRIIANQQDLPLCDLDSLPYWDDRLYLPHYPEQTSALSSGSYFLSVDVGRGCPFSCTFCSSSRFWRRTYRLKSPDRIVEDMLHFHKKFGVRSFSFGHDAFTINKKLVSQVCDKLMEQGLDFKWKCTTRVDCIDEELILKMKKAGLRQIELGIETGSARMQKLIRKNLDLDRVCHMVDFLLENRLEVALFFMYGFPDETEEDLAQTLSLLFSLLDKGVGFVSMSYCHFNPNTELTRQYFDDLVFEPDIKILSQGVEGYEESLELFRQHKALFPFMYHLHTPVRDRYPYLYFLVRLYSFFPKTGRYLRELYGGDDLRLYRDFHEHNRRDLEQDFATVTLAIQQKPLELIGNTLRDFEPQTAKRILSLIEFDIDLRRIRHAKQDREICRIYDFNYADFAAKRPLAQYGPGRTEIRLSKRGGKQDLQILRFLK